MILCLDTETGGLGVEVSLLQIALVVADNEYNVVDNLTLDVKPIPVDGRSIYVVQGEALAINKIDLAKHDLLAFNYKIAGSLVYDFLDQYSNHGKIKLVLTGKNVHFDVWQVWDKLMKRSTWEHFVSYQWMDLSSVWKFLVLQKLAPDLPKTSLSSLCEHFDIPTDQLHHAKDDCLYTLQVLKKISEFLP